MLHRIGLFSKKKQRTASVQGKIRCQLAVRRLIVYHSSTRVLSLVNFYLVTCQLASLPAVAEELLGGTQLVTHDAEELLALLQDVEV